MEQQRSFVTMFRHASAREKLGVVADVLSVLGVSIATVTGGALVLAGDIYVENLVAAVVFSLLYLATAFVLAVGVIAASVWLRNRFGEQNPLYNNLLQTALWLVVASAVILAALLAYELLSSVQISRN